MEKILILIRHSLPEVTEDVPAREWKLSDDGRALAHRLAERLRQYQPEVIASSVEPKAKETAEIVASKFGIKSQVFEDLHEHDRSGTTIFPGKSFKNPSVRFLKSQTCLFLETKVPMIVICVLNGLYIPCWIFMQANESPLPRMGQSFLCLCRA